MVAEPYPRIRSLWRKAQLAHVALQANQRGALGNEVRSEIQNSLSSFWSEFDGCWSIHAGGAGGRGHVTATGWTAGGDAQPASAINNSAAQAIVFCDCMGFLLGAFFVNLGKFFLVCSLVGGHRLGGLRGEIRNSAEYVGVLGLRR